MTRSAMWSRSAHRRRVVVGLIASVLLVALAAPVTGEAHASQGDPRPPARWRSPSPSGVRSEDVGFRSGDLTLRGTVLLPDEPGPHPAVALLAGSGAGPRDKYRLEAEAFAQAGIVTLIYDKRTSGYSASGAGERSYALLADDALAAVSLLRGRSDVDPSAVGLWGHSEGGWVAPLAASQSTDVAFVVTVGASAVPGAQQTLWAFGNRLHHLGVSGSLVNSYLPAIMRLLVSTGVFPEADYDGVETWEQVQQPVLAVWGAQDLVVPPAESSQILTQALERGGNQAYAIRFVPGEHAAHTSPDGIERDDILAPGYTEAVTSWVHSVANGEPDPGPVEQPPAQDRPSTPINPIAWYQSAPIQLTLFALIVAAFLAYPITALARRLRRREGPPPSATRRAARWLTTLGLVTALGVPATYVPILAGNVGAVVAQRPVPWLALQALAVATVVAAAGLASGWRRAASTAGRRVRASGSEPVSGKPAEGTRRAVLLAGAVLFVPWAAYWGVLLP